MDTRSCIAVGALALATACGVPEGWPRTLEVAPGGGDARAPMELHGGDAPADRVPEGSAWADRDDDGAVALHDCDDGDPAVHPGAPDPCGDGLDADCDGDDTCPDATAPGPQHILTADDARRFCERWDAVDGDLRIHLDGVDLTALGCLRLVTGSLRITSRQLDDTAGLRRLQAVGGDLHLDLPSTQGVGGFELLSRIGGDLHIDVEQARSIEAFPTLARVGGDLVFVDTAIRDAPTFPALAAIGGTLVFEPDALGTAPTLPTMPALTRAGGIDLAPQRTLRSLEGLPHLARLHTGAAAGTLRIEAGPLLDTIDGLPMLRELGELALHGSGTAVTGLHGIRHLDHLEISHAPSLRDLSGLAGLERVSGSVALGPDVRIAGRGARGGLESLEQVGSLRLEQATTMSGGTAPTLPALHTIEGDLTIRGRTLAPFENLPALRVVGGDLDAGPEPRDARRLVGLEHVGGDLRLAGDPGRSGLSSLRQVGGSLWAPDLVETAPLSGLTRVGGDLALAPTADLVGLSRLQEVGGDLDLTGSTAVDLDGLAALHTIGGDLQIREALDLRDASALAGLEQVGGDLVLDWTPALAALDLGTLTSVGGDLRITRARRLTRAAGLDALIEVGGDLELGSLRDLPDLDDLSALQLVGGDLIIRDNTRLSDLRGAGALTEVGGDVSIVGNGWLSGDQAWAFVEEIPHIGGVVRVADNRP